MEEYPVLYFFSILVGISQIFLQWTVTKPSPQINGIQNNFGECHSFLTFTHPNKTF